VACPVRPVTQACKKKNGSMVSRMKLDSAVAAAESGWLRESISLKIFGC
jgi:hypothetical protein